MNNTDRGLLQQLRLWCALYSDGIARNPSDLGHRRPAFGRETGDLRPVGQLSPASRPWAAFQIQMVLQMERWSGGRLRQFGQKRVGLSKNSVHCRLGIWKAPRSRAADLMLKENMEALIFALIASPTRTDSKSGWWMADELSLHGGMSIPRFRLPLDLTGLYE